eukprot:CAMPEP_0181119772 /NCGR_PEP_ID=MMETSP1071-20121207/23779_1 /TAXON_ID=35127 /ORGANISM="Thalassiosira sp., Strain NH16" /LENGTH=264 /DNA_ID=CAMNT_0023204339 /DNA_START=93 /DNA_END=887 /DNA_ORIENTATION=+
MIFKSIYLAMVLLAAPTSAVVSSSNSTKLSNDTTAEPRLGAVADDGTHQRRDVSLSSAFVFLNRGAVHGLGHVGGCFEEEDGDFTCFSDDGPNARPQFWTKTDIKQADVLLLFKGKEYTDWKRLDVYSADPAQALTKMNEVMDQNMKYNLVWRNCQNDVYDILHDEGSGFGITADWTFKNNGCYIGWVQEVMNPGPTHWFDENIAATETGYIRSGKGEKCWDNFWHKYCDYPLTCCDGRCKQKVNKKWCVGWWNWPCFDNWKCP